MGTKTLSRELVPKPKDGAVRALRVRVRIRVRVRVRGLS